MPDPTTPYSSESDSGPGFAAGDLLATRYRIVAALGKGGMGEVYRADDLTLGQPVALKFLPPHLASDPDRLQRFRKEVAAARKVSHPHVCRVYDIAEHAGQSFLTMEYIDGEDLASLLKRVGRVPEEKGVEIARQFAAALGAVHDQGLLHRDLKPANVMLDGRGQVRLTDFGLAAVAGQADDVRSGTPRYRAPEQAAGREVTARSDLYSLGLVLYEVFTGRRAWPGEERAEPPSKPSSHLSTLDPAVERVILKCLEADPAHRPKSVVEVLAGLPGGDPLAAALAAGETPSPKMVADAPIEGTLRPAVAVALFAFVFGGLLAIAAVNDHFKAYRALPLPPPAELEFKAKALLRELGYPQPRPFAASGYENDLDSLRDLRSAQRGDLLVSERPHLASARPALAVFFYRESPRFLGHIRQEGITPIGARVVVTPDNPPHDVPGMAGLVLDSHGRLVELTAVPDASATPPTMPVEWTALLKAAGLDAPGVLKEDPNPGPPVTPPVFADRTAAWEGTYPERPAMRIRVEAGSYQGRPVFFRIVHPDRPAGLRPENEFLPPNRFLNVFFALFMLMVLVGFVFFAVRNYRRADVRGALLLGGSLLLVTTLEWLFSGRHLYSPSIGVSRYTQFLGRELYYVALAVGGYLTFEPIVRRRCPHLLTAWTRLIAGRWRDPLIGRDLLIGIAAAVLVVFDAPANSLLNLDPSRTGVVNPRAFTAPGQVLFWAAGNAIGANWFYASIFAVFLAIVRRQWIAFGLLFGLLMLAILSLTEPRIWPIVWDTLRVLVPVLLFARFGILAAIGFVFTRILTTTCPLSLDPSAWYFGASMLYMLVIAALAAFAAWTSLGSRPLFGKGFFADD